MKLGLILLFCSPMIFAASLNLDVADQNFNSTEKIIIDQDEIQKSRASSIPALLLTKANIAISTSNVQPNSIYIRGGDSSHVLILVDGVPTYDASSPQRTINLFNLNVSKIKRIEILKGSQSVLYGGQAMSGVIKIETFGANTADETFVMADSAFMRNSGAKQSVSLNTLKNVNELWALNANLYGLQALNNSPVQSSDKLYPQQSVAADISAQFKSDWVHIFKLSYSQDRNEINDSSFTNSKAIDTDDFVAQTKTQGAAWVIKKPEVISVVASWQKINRAFDQPAAKALLGATVDQKYEGTLSNIRLDGYLYRSAELKLASGLQLNTESMDSQFSGVTATKDSAQYEGVYLKSDYNFSPDLFFELGIRHESSKMKPLADSCQVGISWNQTLKAEYSTGFKTPSLFQLFAMTYGNPDLKSETSKNFSLTLEHQFSDQFYLSLTYFDSQFENLIDFSFTLNKYNNISRTRTVGVEAQAQMNFLENLLRLSLNLGYQEPRDLARSAWLVRRPLHSAGLKVSGDIGSTLDGGVEIFYVGEKQDKAGAPYVTLADYALVNIFTNWKVSSVTAVFARIENFEGLEYQTTYGYYNKGTLYKIGAQFNF